VPEDVKVVCAFANEQKARSSNTKKAVLQQERDL